MNLKTAATRTVMLMMVVALLTVLSISPASAGSAGPNNAGLGQNVTGVGTVAWTNPNEITVPGGTAASVGLSAGNPVSNYLQGTQYGFAIPAGSTINGITVTINRRASNASPVARDNILRLVKAGSLVGDNKASATGWPTTYSTAVYGGPTDLWGTTWTPEEINSSGFGVALSVVRTSGDFYRKVK